jgi:hypothetical protein
MLKKNIIKSIPILLLLICSQLFAQQNNLTINAEVDIITKQIKITQTIDYFNNTEYELTKIYLHDWNNSFSSKNTPLAKRFSEDYSTKFLFAKENEYGFTKVFNITQNKQFLKFKRLDNHPDVLEVTLQQSLKPNSSYTINLEYVLKLPSDTFTRYGITENDDLHLKYWYITPAIYNGKWNYFSNKELDDLFVPKSNITLNIKFPLNYQVTSELDFVTRTQNTNSQTVTLTGNQRTNTKLFLNKLRIFKTIQTDDFNIITDITEKNIKPEDKAIIIDRITSFITNNLGDYPFKNLLVTTIDDKKDPVYGLNQLPNFIRPYPSNFLFELKLLKSSLNNYLENTLLINPRKDQWLKDAFQIYYLMKYVETNYPDMKLLGSLAKIWGIRSFHLADLKFNEQYILGYMNMARSNRDQPIAMQKDSLLKFNENIANKYKAALGLKYLDNYIDDNNFDKNIKQFLNQNQLKTITSKDFENFIKSKTTKNIDWFFSEFLQSRKKIDYKIKNIKQTKDSVTIVIKNKNNTKTPISLFTLNDDSIISKKWINDINKTKTITISKSNFNKLALNYDNAIPEVNLRDNWKTLKRGLFNNKPFQFRVFKDVEDPYYNQVFFMPLVQFNNIYDGLTLGTSIYNKTILKKPFKYKLAPQYATKSKSLTGSASVFNTHYLDDRNLFQITYGIRGVYKSYAEDLFFSSIAPSVLFKFRNKNDLRSNKKQALNIRFIKINRDEDVNNITDLIQPDYSVFNARFTNSNVNLENLSHWFADFQLADNFSKISFNYQYRKLLNSNRQISVRVFSGLFLHNKTSTSSDYFSFALDRPTDYLFSYNYFGRSEDTGIFSQQLIIAEGGFKSKLQPAFANQWITTANVSTSIWRHFQVYGDIGLVKNKYDSAKFVYDSGVRLNLVQDYFEIYFPVYSNLGWEIGQPNYSQKIRFIFTLDPQSLLGIFRRKWY